MNANEPVSPVRSTAAARARSGWPSPAPLTVRAIPAALFQPAPPRPRRVPRRTLRHKLLGWLNSIVS